jgi:hypothetical protein
MSKILFIQLSLLVLVSNATRRMYYTLKSLPDYGYMRPRIKNGGTEPDINHSMT